MITRVFVSVGVWGWTNKQTNWQYSHKVELVRAFTSYPQTTLKRGPTGLEAYFKEASDQYDSQFFGSYQLGLPQERHYDAIYGAGHLDDGQFWAALTVGDFAAKLQINWQMELVPHTPPAIIYYKWTLNTSRLTLRVE
ncbi:hypothetical protein MP228_005286 [Amoeboaphelidium protococcarum]|nr:hypothetical protein MP228_005286 [Amoeboaphelidium protococcarum]